MIKVDQKSLVLFLHQHLLKKIAAGIALRIEHSGLTATGVDQQAKSEREIRVLRKILDGLRTAVFLQREVIFREVADDLIVLVANRYRKSHDSNVDSDGSGGVLRRLFLGRVFIFILRVKGEVNPQ